MSSAFTFLTNVALPQFMMDSSVIPASKLILAIPEDSNEKLVGMEVHLQLGASKDPGYCFNRMEVYLRGQKMGNEAA